MNGPRMSNRRLVAVATAVVVVIGACGAALAYWLGSGTGAGTATTGTAAAVTLTPGTPTAQLYPGGQADVALIVSNPNTTTVTIASLAPDTTRGSDDVTVDAAHSGCEVATLTFTTQTNAGAGWSVPGKSGSVDGTLPISLSNALAMGADAPNACQGAQFTVYLVAGS